MMRRWWIVLLVLLAPLAQAATVHVFLDRTHVSLGDTVTLNIQSNGSIGTPDLSPLQKDFQVLGTSRSSSVQIINGQSSQTSQLGIALKPLHAGTLTVPALNVGGAKTLPLTLEVGAAPSGGTANFNCTSRAGNHGLRALAGAARASIETVGAVASTCLLYTSEAETVQRR